MSIISLDKEEVSRKSIGKSIDQGAQTLVYDILQKTQYVKPIESCVRESVSNAIDALKEKEVAQLILSGKVSIEDYFITRDGDEYKDSNFDPTYYNLQFFDVNNRVTIEHFYNEGVGFCDNFVITDTGVGLSPQRMYSLFSLGFSTKRNTNKGALGGLNIPSPR